MKRFRRRLIRPILNMLVVAGYDVVRLPAYRARRPKGVRVDLQTSRFVTPLGSFVVPADSRNDVIAEHIIRGIVFEQEIVDACAKFIPLGGVVVDVGANLGQMSVEFSRIVGPTGSVHSFEAQPYLFPFLVENLRANTNGVAKPFLGAVGEVDGGFTYFPKPDLREFGSYGSYPIPVDSSCDEKDRVARVTLDSILKVQRLDLIKVDVQGYDLFVLRGAISQIRKYKPAILFEFESQFQADVGTCFQDYLDFLREIEYEVYEVINGINYLCRPGVKVS